jgi:leucine dehydrogenase
MPTNQSVTLLPTRTGPFELPDYDDHEELAFFTDKDSGLRAIVAVHSTALGPALGGARMRKYESSAEALTDVIRLARGMSYKSAIANVPHGGGKSVILHHPGTKPKELLLAFGAAVSKMNGRYITSADMNIHDDDLKIIAEATPYVAGFPQPGRSGGNPSPVTALGVFKSMMAITKYQRGTDSLSGLRVAIQGLGEVGLDLAKRLHEGGAKLIVADPDQAALRRAVDRFGATPVAPEEILSVECDMFSPCAIGGILTSESIENLKATMVVGCANNQLASDECGAALKAKGILYAPDIVVNAGGVICVAGQINDWDDAEIRRRTLEIEDTLLQVLRRAQADNLPTNIVADQIAKERIGRG